jgi:hypothetical protein
MRSVELLFGEVHAEKPMMKKTTHNFDVKYRGSNFLSEKSYEVLKKIHLQTKEV